MAEASTNRTSPPVPVTARPVATPGTAVRSAASVKNFAPAEDLAHVVGADRDRRRRPRRLASLRGGLAQQRADVALERADARLARVVADRCAGRRPSSIVTSSGSRPLRRLLARDQVALGDRDLLVLGVAVEADHLEPVEQRRRDLVGHVRRGDEQHLRQVELDVEVVVAERRVLRRVEHLEQRRTRDRPASRRRACRPRRAGSPGSSCRRRAGRGRGGPGARRRRCAGGRGSRPRRARRRATCGRTCGRARGRSTRRATSCRRRAGRRAPG